MKFHWVWPKLCPSITRPWWIAHSAIMSSCIFNMREHCISHDASYANKIHAHKERHAMILVFWIETSIIIYYHIRSVIIQMKPMNRWNSVIIFLTNKSHQWNAKRRKRKKEKTKPNKTKNTILTKNENTRWDFLFLPILDGVIMDGHPNILIVVGTL